MSHARIEIEHINSNKWVAEVEAGFPRCRRARVVASSYGGIISEISAKMAEFYPQPTKKVMADIVVPPEPDDGLTKQILAEQAKSLGIDIDGRWGVERLKQVIADHEGMAELENAEPHRDDC